MHKKLILKAYQAEIPESVTELISTERGRDIVSWFSTEAGLNFLKKQSECPPKNNEHLGLSRSDSTFLMTWIASPEGKAYLERYDTVQSKI